MNVKTVFMVYLMLTLFQLCGAHANTYSGTQAYNHSKLFTASVNTATGTFNFAYPLIKAPGITAPFHLSVNYHFNNTGMYGLPTGWGLDLDYISDKTARLGGKQWLIDPLWHDETKFASGLKYYNQHGSYFEDAGVAKEIPGHKGLFYRYKATHKDGSLKYFSHQGLLVLEVDRFGSTVQFEYQKPVRDLTSARVTQITDNYGNRYRFSYEPNTLIVRYPDGREQKLYFNEKGVTDIINPLQQSYKISYLQQDSQNLIRSIEAPTGLITQLTYDSIPYKNGSATKHMPVVINFKQQDIATHETHHETHYKYAQGNNYTGYPLYALSSDGDSLMDSNDQGYRYSVEVNRSNADPTTPLMHQKIYSYNYLHLPAEILTQHQGRQYLKTTYEYAISPFKYSRSTNYDKPTVVTNLVWHADKNTYIPSDKITTAYDNYGNKTDERRFVYDPDKKQWIATQSKQQHYFTDNYSLPKETQHIDEISGKVLRTQYTLSPNGKTHARKTTAYRDGQGASGQGEPGQENTWHPWQQETLRYDGQGREILSTLEQLAKPPAEVQGVGIKSTHRQTHYHFNNSNGQLLTESISALGNIHSKVVDTRNGHQLKTITPLQETTAYTYDALGQQLTQTDPIGNVIRSSYAVYQTCGLNATTHQSPLGDQKRMIYDASHREIETQDQYNQQWRSLHKKAYNGWGKVIQTTDILGLTAHRDYDEQERLIRAEDPWGNEKTIHYNDSQMTTTTYHNGHKTTTKTQIPWQLITRTATYPVFENLYDIQENYLEKTLQHNGFGQVTEETSRLLRHQIKTPSDTLTSHYTYDASHNRTHSDTRGYDGSRYQRHTYYDLFNNKITHQKTVYTQAGSTTHLGYRYHYDEDNRLTQTETPLIDGHFSNSTQHHYDKNGRQIQTTLQNGHVVDYQYNPLGQGYRAMFLISSLKNHTTKQMADCISISLWV